MGKSCFVALAPLVQWLLILGFLSSWWNNRLAQRIHGSGRLVNLNEYLVLQVVFLAARSFSVWALRDPSSSFIPIPQEAAHLFMALFIVIVSMIWFLRLQDCLQQPVYYKISHPRQIPQDIPRQF
jgi:hypothetical protein